MTYVSRIVRQFQWNYRLQFVTLNSRNGGCSFPVEPNDVVHMLLGNRIHDRAILLRSKTHIDFEEFLLFDRLRVHKFHSRQWMIVRRDGTFMNIPDRLAQLIVEAV